MVRNNIIFIIKYENLIISSSRLDGSDTTELGIGPISGKYKAIITDTEYLY